MLKQEVKWFALKLRSAKERSEEEVQYFLEKHFGTKDVELHPKVGNKKADFRIKSIDTYIEVHAIKNISSDLIEIQAETKLAFGIIREYKLKDNGQKKEVR